MHREFRICRTIAIVAVSLGFARLADGGSTITALGFLPATHNSIANGISADGRVVVGTASAHGFRWTATGGMTDLGFLSPFEETIASCVSSDGSVVAGESTNLRNLFEAFRWTEAGGMAGVAVDYPGSQARGISGDGTVLAGMLWPSAVVWTATGEMTAIGILPGGSDSVANAISADGSTVVGLSSNALGVYEAFRWTPSGGLVGMGYLPSGSSSQAQAVSADGRVIVGYGHVAEAGQTSTHAWRWTAAGGMVDLGLGGAYAVSSDGRVVAGANQDGAWVWTAASGMKTVRLQLLADGVDLKHWQNLSAVYGVSADGQWLVGYGASVSADNEAFLASLPSLAPPPVPRLAATRSGSGLSLAWTPTGAGAGVVLESSSSLATPDWQAVPGFAGDQPFQIPASDAARWFRLRLP